jgi:hypothetical protein
MRDHLIQAAAFVGQMITDHPNEFITAVATCVVAAFTVILALSTKRLWKTSIEQSRDMKASIAAANATVQAAITANQIAVTNAEQQLRAYVTAKGVNLTLHRQPATPGAYLQIEGLVHTYGLAAILRNGGKTPATNVTVNVSCQKLSKTLPATFDFPDSTLFGHGLIGPDSEMHTPLIRISAGELEPIEADTDWYLWGWIEYDDVFTGTLRHRTEFCFQTERARLPVTDEFWIGFKHHARFNAADSDCLRPIDPHTNRSG